MRRKSRATPGQPQEHWRRRKSLWLIAAVVVVVGAGVAVSLSDPFSSGTATRAGDGDNRGPTSLYTVTRQGLSSQTQVPATLGYAGSFSVVNQAQGTVTLLPAVGQVVSQGQVLYQVSGAPVVLLYGSTPAYRTLSSGLTGPDVQELNYDLVALGEYPTGELGLPLTPSTRPRSTESRSFRLRLESHRPVLSRLDRWSSCPPRPESHRWRPPWVR